MATKERGDLLRHNPVLNRPCHYLNRFYGCPKGKIVPKNTCLQRVNSLNYFLFRQNFTLIASRLTAWLCVMRDDINSFLVIHKQSCARLLA